MQNRRYAGTSACSVALLPFGIILKEPDLGSALVFMPSTLVMMFVAGVPRAMLGKFIGGGAVAGRAAALGRPLLP